MLIRMWIFVSPKYNPEGERERRRRWREKGRLWAITLSVISGVCQSAGVVVVVIIHVVQEAKKMQAYVGVGLW
jgi:hypothetical protein